jgi:hypothetical protein
LDGLWARRRPGPAPLAKIDDPRTGGPPDLTAMRFIGYWVLILNEGGIRRTSPKIAWIGAFYAHS